MLFVYLHIHTNRKQLITVTSNKIMKHPSEITTRIITFEHFSIIYIVHPRENALSENQQFRLVIAILIKLTHSHGHFNNTYVNSLELKLLYSIHIVL